MESILLIRLNLMWLIQYIWRSGSLNKIDRSNLTFNRDKFDSTFYGTCLESTFKKSLLELTLVKTNSTWHSTFDLSWLDQNFSFRKVGLCCWPLIRVDRSIFSQGQLFTFSWADSINLWSGWLDLTFGQDRLSSPSTWDDLVYLR